MLNSSNKKQLAIPYMYLVSTSGFVPLPRKHTHYALLWLTAFSTYSDF